jgi:hypothetical protein
MNVLSVLMAALAVASFVGKLKPGHSLGFYSGGLARCFGNPRCPRRTACCAGAGDLRAGAFLLDQQQG